MVSFHTHPCPSLMERAELTAQYSDRRFVELPVSLLICQVPLMACEIPIPYSILLHQESQASFIRCSVFTLVHFPFMQFFQKPCESIRKGKSAKEFCPKLFNESWTDAAIAWGLHSSVCTGHSSSWQVLEPAASHRGKNWGSQAVI